MRVFVAGATGAIGGPLVRQLVARGHDVAGLTRKLERAQRLRDGGATAVVCDLYDPALAGHIAAFGPDVVIHQVTDLPSRQALVPMRFVSLNKARTRGTDILAAAAREAGASTFIAQSIAFPVPAMAQKGVDHLEATARAFPGIVLRYGLFYGPGTWYAAAPASSPIVHVEKAAAATVEVLGAAPGVYEITDAGTRVVDS
jgi:uncharacterized protein YbjT (DUF2867 family)